MSFVKEDGDGLAMFSECLSQQSQGGSLLDGRWKKEERKAKGDMEKDSGQRDEGKGLVVELFGDPGQGQTSVEVNG